jgi:formylglycine-generating enzyme required for sulfatase activity
MGRKLLVVCVLMGAVSAAHAGVRSSVPDIKLAGVVPKNSAEQFELAFWESIKDSSHAGDYEAYLKAYPKGRFVALAQVRIARLRAAAEKPAPVADTAPAAPLTKPAPVADVAPATPAAKPARPPAKVAARAKRTVAKAEPETDRVEPVATGGEAAVRGEIQDCQDCPALVSLSPGSFTMGSNASDPSEQPAHRVALSRPFAIGKYEVTVAEWNACVEAGACIRVGQYVSATPKAPIRDVSWDDAQQYLQWLSANSGKPYRLPSEAEWEYAARGGASTRYWWGDQMAVGKANCRECGPPWRIDGPADAGSFAANQYGIYDMNGSVWEWVSDCWHSSYEGAPADGKAWDQADCGVRVLRGGSWREPAPTAAAPSRSRQDAGARQSQNGFRVARDVE